jgi:hypothetical protein
MPSTISVLMTSYWELYICLWLQSGYGAAFSPMVLNLHHHCHSITAPYSFSRRHSDEKYKRVKTRNLPTKLYTFFFFFCFCFFAFSIDFKIKVSNRCNQLYIFISYVSSHPTCFGPLLAHHQGCPGLLVYTIWFMQCCCLSVRPRTVALSY